MSLTDIEKRIALEAAQSADSIASFHTTDNQWVMIFASEFLARIRQATCNFCGTVTTPTGNCFGCGASSNAREQKETI